MGLNRREFLAAGTAAATLAAAPRAFAQWQPSQRYPDPSVQIVDQGFARYRLPPPPPRRRPPPGRRGGGGGGGGGGGRPRPGGRPPPPPPSRGGDDNAGRGRGWRPAL